MKVSGNIKNSLLRGDTTLKAHFTKLAQIETHVYAHLAMCICRYMASVCAYTHIGVDAYCVYTHWCVYVYILKCIL